MADLKASQEENGGPTLDKGFGQKHGEPVKDALQADDEFGRDAPSSKVGYGGCGGDLPSPGKQNQVHKRYMKAVGTPGPQCFLEQSDEETETEGSGESDGHGQTENGRSFGMTNTAVHATDPYNDHTRGLANGEENGSADEVGQKPLKSKLKEMIPRHHDHKHVANGEEGLAKMPNEVDEEHQGVLSKLKHKIIDTHEKHLDEPDPKVWG